MKKIFLVFAMLFSVVSFSSAYAEPIKIDYIFPLEKIDAPNIVVKLNIDELQFLSLELRPSLMEATLSETLRVIASLENEGYTRNLKEWKPESPYIEIQVKAKR